MKADGIKVPLAWGHQPKALPAEADRLAESEYHKSRYNAGYVEDLDVTPDGALEMTGSTPGLQLDPASGSLTDPEAGTAIQEVSAGIRDWRDGKGRLWKDSLVHVALTPLPVWHGQDGFRQAEPAGEPVTQLSLTALLRLGHGDTDMADEKDDKKDKKDDSSPEAASGGGPSIKDVLTDLSEYGIVLPDDTNDDNFYDRLCTALKALKGAPSEDGAASMDDVDEAMAGATEEPSGTMMSTSKDPFVTALLERVEQDDRQRRLARIDALVKRGLPVVRANALREQATQVRFGLTTEGKAVEPEIDRQLSLLEDVLPEHKFAEDYLSRLVEEPPPEDSKTRYRQIADEMARNGGLPARRN